MQHVSIQIGAMPKHKAPAAVIAKTNYKSTRTKWTKFAQRLCRLAKVLDKQTAHECMPFAFIEVSVKP